MSNAYTILKHRAIFDLYAIKEDGDPFMAASEQVVDWFVEKERRYDGSPIAEDFARRGAFPLALDYRSPEDYEGGDYDADQWPALACASERDGSVLRRWAVEYDEPDAGHDDRRWHTTICLERLASDQCRVAMQTTCRPLGEPTEPLPTTIAAPSLLRTIIALPWFVAKVGPTQLQTVPNKLTVQTFDHFVAALNDPERRIPLVLFCTGYDGKIPEQAKQLARRALGTANVYVLDWSNEALRAKEEALFERGTAAGEYACPRSSCRMYMPGIDLTNPNASMSHESWNREALQELRPSQFAERLARRFLPSQVVYGVAGEPQDEADGIEGTAASPVR